MKSKFKYIFIFLFFFLITNNVYALEIDNLSSKNVIMINMDNEDVIYEKKPDERVSIASTTKIMTAIVAIENIDDYSKKVEVTYDMIKDIPYDYAVAGFSVSEEVSYNDLLYATLLKSGADATNVLAYSIGGSIEGYANMMNEKAKELKMSNTHFTNAIGEDDENHYSSARDLSILLKYAFKNKKFKEIFKEESYTLENGKKINGPLKYLKNENINANYVLGAKTGYTSIAGLCLASVSNYESNNFILVVLGANEANKYQAMLDTKEIYDYFFNNYEYKKILSKGDEITKVKSVYDKEYEILSDEDIVKYLLKDDIENLEYKYDGEKTLDKNILKGDLIGTYYISSNGKLIYEKKIYAPEDVKITFDYFINHNKYLFICLFGTLVIFIVGAIIMKKKKIKLI